MRAYRRQAGLARSPVLEHYEEDRSCGIEYSFRKTLRQVGLRHFRHRRQSRAEPVEHLCREWFCRRSDEHLRRLLNHDSFLAHRRSLASVRLTSWRSPAPALRRRVRAGLDALAPDGAFIREQPEALVNPAPRIQLRKAPKHEASPELDREHQGNANDETPLEE